MAFGEKICACCGSVEGIEAHHLYLRADGCPDDLTVFLCHVCHGRTHGLSRRMNLSTAISEGMAKARERGSNLGRPRIPTFKRDGIIAALSEGTGINKVARQYGVGVLTVQRIKKEMVQ